jgi:hypothetical protein
MKRLLLGISCVIFMACSHDNSRPTTPSATMRTASAAEEQDLNRGGPPPPLQNTGPAPSAAPPPK